VRPVLAIEGDILVQGARANTAHTPAAIRASRGEENRNKANVKVSGSRSHNQMEVTGHIGVADHGRTRYSRVPERKDTHGS